MIMLRWSPHRRIAARSLRPFRAVSQQIGAVMAEDRAAVARASPSIARSIPATDSWADKGAPGPPMSVRTQPGLMATTTVAVASSSLANLTVSMLSPALLMAYLMLPGGTGGSSSGHGCRRPCP